MVAVRIGAVVVALVTAVILQVSALPLLGLPGATPDLVLVVVAAIGLCTNEIRGAVAGFGAGLLLDLAPPSLTLFGVSAAVLVAVGAAAGSYGRRPDRSALGSLALVAGLAGAAVALRAALGGILGDPRVVWDQVPALAVSNALYAAVLAAFVIPAVRVLLRERPRPV